ncbi:MAG: hypothetical protein JXN59_06385 [Anaerolineae bacterium]|nr:hypothetical protein [Anaerolineae bacterium]
MLAFLRDDYRLSKRMLGFILLVVGLVGVIGLLGLDPAADFLHGVGIDILSPDRQAGFGPMQRVALLVSGVLVVAGLSLIPLRDAPPVLPAAGPVETPRTGLRAAHILLGIILVALLFYFVIYLVYAVNIIQFPFDYDQGEGFELVDTIMFSQGRWPYQNTEVYPFYSSNYPPLFHIIAVPFVWLFGPAYWYGRVLAVLGTLVTAGAIGYAVYRAERHALLAAISGLAYLASNYIYHVGPLFRQHLFMVMLETLAVVVLAQVHDIEAPRQRRRTLLIGLGLVLAAGFTKQHAIFTAVAVFLFLFVNNPRRSLTWGVLFALVGGGIFLWIDRSTGGQWWLNIITANVNPFVPGQLPGLFRQWFGLHGALVILAGLMVIYEVYFDRISLYSFWFAAVLLSTTLAGKWGAGDSYFATTIAAACILSGILAARTLNAGWRWPENYLTRLARPLGRVIRPYRVGLLAAARVAIPLVYALYVVAVFHMPTAGPVFGPLARALGVESNTGFALYDSAGWTVGYAVIGQIPTEEEIANGWRLVEIVAEGDKPAISEDASFSLLAGKDVVGNPTQLRNLYNNDLYDPSALVAMIEDQAFGVIILRALFYPDPVLAAMMDAYAPAESIPMNGFDYQVLRPDPGWPERRAAQEAGGDTPPETP